MKNRFFKKGYDGLFHIFDGLREKTVHTVIYELAITGITHPLNTWSIQCALFCGIILQFTDTIVVVTSISRYC